MVENFTKLIFSAKVFNEFVSAPEICIRGAAFLHTALRELYMSKVINNVLEPAKVIMFEFVYEIQILIQDVWS